MRELPRDSSIFDLVLHHDGPVIVPDSRQSPKDSPLMARIVHARFFASAPVRSPEGYILAALTVFSVQPRALFTSDQIRVLESLADLVAGQLELRRLRAIASRPRLRADSLRADASAKPWPRCSDLRRALDRREFVLHYQPEIDLSTRRIVAVEALIRWVHPERGMLPPKDFIPQAEECGLILPIGDWGLAEACSQIQAWNREDAINTSLRVCVNLSARQFARPGLADHVQSLLVHTGVASHQLGLEMTESSLIPNLGTAVDVLNDLHAIGVSLHMDDFGTGYSSLNYLHSFPFDVLKIDRSFVGQMPGGEQSLQDRSHHRRSRPGTWHERRSRRHRNLPAICPPSTHGLPLRSGLSLRPAHAGGTTYCPPSPPRSRPA